MSGLKAIHIYFAFMAILGAANFGDSQASTFCTDNGNHPHPFGDPDNCKGFYQCYEVDNQWKLLHFTCPEGGVFDESSKACVEGTCGKLGARHHETHGQLDAPTITSSPPSPPKSTTLQPPPTIITKLSTSTTTTRKTTTTTRKPTRTTRRRTTRKPTTQRTTQPITQPGATARCKVTGTFHNPKNCQAWYWCGTGSGKLSRTFYKYSYRCLDDLYYDREKNECLKGACPYAGMPAISKSTSKFDNPASINCQTHGIGNFASPNTCHAYFTCTSTKVRPQPYNCVQGWYFDTKSRVCNSGDCPYY